VFSLFFGGGWRVRVLLLSEYRRLFLFSYSAFDGLGPSMLKFDNIIIVLALVLRPFGS
jgi:hypothetical protein